MLQLDPDVALGRQDLMTLFEQIRVATSNVVDANTPPLLVIGTGSNAKVKVTNTFAFTSKNVPLSKTTAEVAFTATTHNIPANAASVQEAVYWICINASGTLSIVMGAIASGAGNALSPERSAVADGLAIIGSVRIAVVAAAPGAGTSFIAGTTALNDARLVGSAATYVDITGPVMQSFNATQ